MEFRIPPSTFFLSSLLTIALFAGTLNLAGCSAHSLSGPDLEAPVEEVQTKEEGAPNLKNPLHNEDPAHVPTRGNGGSIDYMAEHNETDE